LEAATSPLLYSRRGFRISWQATPEERMLLRDSRRLTGRNLLSDRAGAVADVYLSPGEGEAAAAAAIAAWRRQARRILDAVGWRAEETYVRRFAAGASLALSAPLDGLYAATEINEWAWEAAAAAAGGRGEPGAAALEAAAEVFRAAIGRESDPALIALRAAAARHGVAFLADDDRASAGLGSGSVSWPRGELPPPAAVDWAAVHDIPVALVTGTNGKTTTVRLTAAILEAAGRRVGLTSTDGVTVGRQILDTGDCSGPGGARTLLRDGRVEAAVLETARGGMLRRGLALDRVAAAAVINVAADHLGEYGIDDLAGLADAKLLVTRAVAPAGRAVLNADDPRLAARGSAGPSPVTWCSLEPQHPASPGRIDFAAHLARGGDAVFLAGNGPDGIGGGEIVLARGENAPQSVAALSEVPTAFGGAARHNVVNALVAVGLAAALGAPAAAMAAGLAAVGRHKAADNPGRGHLLEIDGFLALLDYAHNPHGLAAVIAFAATLPAARRLVLLGQAGDRDDEALRELARTAWSLGPDRIVLKELPTMLRGRRPGEVPAILEGELLRLGARRDALSHAASEVEAVRQALDWARRGDLLLLLIHQQRDETLAILDQRRGVRG
jgi:cyanophycin synthetase